VDWRELLDGEIESAYSTTLALLDRVDPSLLDWKPDRGSNWMTVGQLLMHISNACGAGCRAFVTGDWGLPEGVRFEDLATADLLPPASSLPSIESVELARKLLLEDRAVALETIRQIGEVELGERSLAAPWSPTVVRPLVWHLLRMVRHLEMHKAQLFYYLKLQGKAVCTPDLWGQS